MSYESSVLDEEKIKNYAKFVASDLLRKFQPEPQMVEREVVVERWVDEVVFKSRWMGLRQVATTKRTMQPQKERQIVEFVPPPPSRWSLGYGPSGSQRNRLDRRGDYGEEAWSYTYYLLSNGDLVTRVQTNYSGILQGRFFQGSSTDEERPMSDSDMLGFDRGRGGKVWAPAKGVGLHARLTKLRKSGQ